VIYCIFRAACSYFGGCSVIDHILRGGTVIHHTFSEGTVRVCAKNLSNKHTDIDSQCVVYNRRNRISMHNNIRPVIFFYKYDALENNFFKTMKDTFINQIVKEKKRYFICWPPCAAV
jgi:hypothetical protein